ncbi:sulfatase [Martelella soudanensis]|uniref:sulfatase n=1 Tax=unclassified Martelella TaxID=2629616 RepID=UPI0015DE6B1F|nr:MULTISPECIES: sulfatase [unclassified Martelella]
MKTVLLLFDSLNRHMLGCYGGTTVPTPNFDRLAGRSQVYDQHYAGSLPCMPARRDMMTGRLNFLHRSWGPLEPFDNAVPQMLDEAGVPSHLVTDHFHYWEDGGATYHTRYSSFELVRGQQSDPWKSTVSAPMEQLREAYHPRQMQNEKHLHYAVNRMHMVQNDSFPGIRTFDLGLEFIEQNHEAPAWLLQIETFDPHEPFHTPRRFRDPYQTGWNGPIRDWPRYGAVDENPDEADELRANYNASLAMCDEQLGRVLDSFDRLGLWEDTALIVTTDHGFLLGEHEYWAKNRTQMYEEIVHLPLLFHDPRSPGARRIDHLTQTPDLAPTLLDLHSVAPAPEMTGRSLGSDPDRRAVLFGMFGGSVNVTDGRWSYHRYPPDPLAPGLNQYTLMPTHMASRFTPEELSQATLVPPRSWTRGAPLLSIPVQSCSAMFDHQGPGCLVDAETRLYDLVADPAQLAPLEDTCVEARMKKLLIEEMVAHDAPEELFRRLGLNMMAG